MQSSELFENMSTLEMLSIWAALAIAGGSLLFIEHSLANSRFQLIRSLGWIVRKIGFLLLIILFACVLGFALDQKRKSGDYFFGPH